MTDNKTMKKGMRDLMKKGLGKKNRDSKVKDLDLSMLDKLPMKQPAGGMMKKKGYAKGGMMKKGMARGGMTKKGMAKGGMTKKGYKKGGKVRGVGIASKGFRPAKMVTMSKGGKKGGKK